MGRKTTLLPVLGASMSAPVTRAPGSRNTRRCQRTHPKHLPAGSPSGGNTTQPRARLAPAETNTTACTNTHSAPQPAARARPGVPTDTCHAHTSTFPDLTAAYPSAPNPTPLTSPQTWPLCAPPKAGLEVSLGSAPENQAPAGCVGIQQCPLWQGAGCAQGAQVSRGLCMPLATAAVCDLEGHGQRPPRGHPAHLPSPVCVRVST